jgi:hypothetical protein
MRWALELKKKNRPSSDKKIEESTAQFPTTPAVAEHKFVVIRWGALVNHVVCMWYQWIYQGEIGRA